MNRKRDISATFGLPDDLAPSHWIGATVAGITIAVLDVQHYGQTDALETCLSVTEIETANRLDDASERRHFLLRRSFQRMFVADFVDWTKPLHDLPMVHQLDQRTRCSVAPDVMFSFSSSAGLYCACAVRGKAVGIDIEKRRKVEHANDVAARFFSREEADAIAQCNDTSRDELFLKIWTAKEAALKATGHGIVSGLNTFVVDTSGSELILKSPNDALNFDGWQLAYPKISDACIVAVVHRPLR